MDNTTSQRTEFLLCQDEHLFHKRMKKVVGALNEQGHDAELTCVDHVDSVVGMLDERRKSGNEPPQLPTDIIMDASGGNGVTGAMRVIKWYQKNYPDVPLPTFNFLSQSLDAAIDSACALRIRDGRILAGAIDEYELNWTVNRLKKDAKKTYKGKPETTALRKLLNEKFNVGLPLDQKTANAYRMEELRKLDGLANDGVASEWLCGKKSAEDTIEATRKYFHNLAQTIQQPDDIVGRKAQGSLNGLEADASFYGGTGLPQKGIIVFSVEQAVECKNQNPILVMRSYDPSVVPLMANGVLGGMVVTSTYMASHLKLLCETHNVTGLFGVAAKNQKMSDEFNEEARPQDPAYFRADERVTINGQQISSKQDILVGLNGNGLVFKPPVDLVTPRLNVIKIPRNDQFKIQTMTKCFDRFFRDNGLPTHGVKANIDSIGVQNRNLPVSIGLVRTEQMVATDKDLLNNFKQMLLADDAGAREFFCDRSRYAYSNMVKKLDNGPVKIRLFDFVHSEILNKEEQQQFLQKYKRMDIHGAAALNTWPDLYRGQVRTIFSALNKYDPFDQPLEIMMPAVRTEQDTLDIKKVIDEEAKAADIAPERYSFGVMAETLEACKNIEVIAKHCDFISFGTNDLTQQYTGMRRGDLKAHLKYVEQKGFNPFEVLAPEVLDIVRDTTARGRKANPDLKVDVCGAQAADVNAALKLFDAGVDNISVAPTPQNLYVLPMLLNYRRYDAFKSRQPHLQQATAQRRDI